VLAAKNLTRSTRAPPRPGRGGALRAVDNVSLEVRAGETLGIVGESGCGKSTLAGAWCGSRHHAGTVTFGGRDISRLLPPSAAPGPQGAQLVFQDPYRLAHRAPRRRHHRASPWRFRLRRPRARTTGSKTCCTCGPGRSHADRFPTSLRRAAPSASNRPRAGHGAEGDRRRRAGLGARRLHPAQVPTCSPTCRTSSISHVFIAHDLGVVRHVSTRIAVMYLGADHGAGRLREPYAQPAHPYTQALLSAAPEVDGDATEGAPGIDAAPRAHPADGDVPTRWTGRRAAAFRIAAPTPRVVRGRAAALRRWHPAAARPATSPCSPRGRSPRNAVSTRPCQAPVTKHIGFLSFGHWSNSPGRRLGRAADALLQSVDSRKQPKTLEPTARTSASITSPRQLSSRPAAAAIGAKDQPRRIGTAVIEHAYENPLYWSRTPGRPTSSRAEAPARHQPGITRAGHRRRRTSATAARRHDRRRHGPRARKVFLEVLKGQGSPSRTRTPCSPTRPACSPEPHSPGLRDRHLWWGAGSRKTAEWRELGMEPAEGSTLVEKGLRKAFTSSRPSTIQASATRGGQRAMPASRVVSVSRSISPGR